MRAEPPLSVQTWLDTSFILMYSVGHQFMQWPGRSASPEDWARRGLLNPRRETLLGMRDGAYVEGHFT